jgi:predicted ATP-grasp superfamily ATP-dependent carboligase
MIDDLVSWNEDGIRAWEDTADGGERVLLHSLRGFIDAGHAGALLVRQILDEGEPIRVATFDIDRLLDYRSRRPEMVFSVNAFAEYDEPFLVVDLVKDATGRAFLLHHGLEPDVWWEAYVRAVKDIVDRLGVTLVVGAHGIPMAAPHTREIRATIHGTRPDLLPAAPSFFSTVTVPGSASNLVEYRMGEWGMGAISVAVHVPHYLSQAAYPQAAQRMARYVGEMTGLDLAPHKLDEAAREAAEEIEKQVEASEDVQALVRALEQQYDDFMDSRDGVFPLDGRIPTAEELGAEFEKFLADRGKDVP